MQLTIPKGHQISSNAEKILEIKISNSKFSILGELQPSKLWDIYLIDPNNSYKEIIRKDTSEKAFSIFANIILKTPFPLS